MMTMRVVLGALLVSSLVSSFGGLAVAADVGSNEQLVSPERMADLVEVRDVTGDGGVVSGTLVNRSSHAVRNVRLRINHLWLWNDEMHPGEDRYSRTDTYTVPGEIPAGGTRTFTYTPTEPLESGQRGHFTAVVRPMEVTELSTSTAEAPAGEPSPTAGARPNEGARPSDEGARPDADMEGARPTDDERVRPPY
jgi:hypothetical protein